MTTSCNNEGSCHPKGLWCFLMSGAVREQASERQIRRTLGQSQSKDLAPTSESNLKVALTLDCSQATSITNTTIPGKTSRWYAHSRAMEWEAMENWILTGAGSCHSQPEEGPRLYLHCQHQYENTTTTAKSHASETHTNIFAKGLTRRLRSSAPSTSPSAMDTSVVS